MATPQPGSRFGPYTLVSTLGEGGMGAVYRAHDADLHRDVAIKVLRPEVSTDPERLARFAREAQLLASLNHPNIAAIYGTTEAEGTKALVLELIDGPTLADCLATGPLPASEALAIARQIADALDAAHGQGIVHRDLKPANIKLRPDGTVKVLDFGLAKAIEPAAAPANPAASPTITAPTVSGLILGTAAYMSPEQASGKPVDKRADIWAFGVVFSEMLTGRRMFEGETVSHVLAAVLTQTPDLTGVPPHLRPLLARCLEKDPRKRLRDIGDALDLVPSTTARHEEAATPGRGLLLIGGWSLAVALAIALLWTTVFRTSARAGGAAFPALTYVPPPPGTTYRDFGFGAGPVVVSPDGRQLAFSAIDGNGVTRLYVRPLGSERAEVVAGTEDAAWPFWSSDGRSLGFVAGHRLKAVNVIEGGVRTLADAADSGSECGGGGAWGPDGTIVFAPYGCRTPLAKVAATGGSSTPATTLGPGEVGHTAPTFLPDGRHFLYQSISNGGSTAIWMASLDSKDAHVVLKDAAVPQFAAGCLFFVRKNQGIFAQAMDPATGRLSGESTVMGSAERFSVSSAGVLAYQGGTRNGRLIWFDRNGNQVGTVGAPGVYGSVRVSPDGAQVLAELQDGQSGATDMWSFPSADGIPSRLTFGPGTKEFATWSPDGKFIAYACEANGRSGICRKPADGSGTEERLRTLDAGLSDAIVVDWSPDGRYLALNAKIARTLRTGLLIVPIDGDRKPFEVAAVDANQYDGKFSPDGRWIAYFSYESGRPEVFVVPFPGPGGKFQISQTGGWNAQWDHQGRLYYSTLANRLVEADLTLTGDSVKVNALHPLFEMLVPSFPAPFYDVSADGRRVIVIASAGSTSIRSIAVLLNWPARLGTTGGRS